MKLYTRTGDHGQTSLLGGSRVAKHDIRIEAYGTVDELNSWLGLLRDQIPDDHEISTLIGIQEDLFVIGSHLASEPSKANIKIPDLPADAAERLEREMDRMEEAVPALRSFILPGGHVVVSHCHIARCICRRAERRVIALGDAHPPAYTDIIRYLNRLSDYLFMLARFESQRLGVAETPWNPR